MRKQTVIAVAVFAVLALAYLATREKQVSVGVAKFAMPAVKAEDITKIEVRGARNATLTREANGWQVSDPAKPAAQFPADESQVQSAIKALADFKAPDLVSENTAKHADYEVDDAKGWTVSVIGKTTPLRFVFGKASKSGGTYVRKADESGVFSTSSPVAYQLKRGVSDWRKKTIATAPLTEIDSVTVAPAKAGSFQLKRGAADA